MISKLKLTLNGLKIDAKRANVPIGHHDEYKEWACPVCKHTRQGTKAICCIIQYGFEWDGVTTVMKCPCGQQFFSEYKTWHALPEEG